MREQQRPLQFARHVSAPPDVPLPPQPQPPQQQQYQLRSRPASIREAVVAALVGADAGGGFPLGRTATMPASVGGAQRQSRYSQHPQPFQQHQPPFQQHQPPEQRLELQQQQPSRRPSRHRTHSDGPGVLPRRHSARTRPRHDPSAAVRRRASARVGRESSSAAGVERWMDGWHAADDGGHDYAPEGAEGAGRDPVPLLPPRRDDESAFVDEAWEEGGEARRRRTLHRVGGMDSLA
jgi:hypothetical protein